MSPNDQLHFEQLLLHLIVSNGLPFTFVENEETIVIFQFIVPGIKLPKRKAIAEKVLKKSSEMLQENIIKIAKNDPDGVTATFDGWTNVKQEHLWEIVLITTSGKPLVWGAYDISAERSKTEDVIRHIEKLISDANEKNINIKAFISDSAGEYAAARRQLRRKYPSKIFLPCMAHQMNLIFGEIFKESILYQRTSKEAIRIVSFFHSSTFFTRNLRDEQMRIYQKTITLITPGDTRWNSYYFCFHSILKSKSALKFLSAKFNDDRTNVTRNNGVSNIPANKKTTNQNGGRKLPDDIADIINDSEFWTTLFELQNLLYPLCGFFNKLQKDTARLHEVLHCFAYTTKIFGYHNDPKFSSKMVERMESRWKFRSSTSNLTWTHIGQWLKFYFESWFNSKPKSILAELIKYKREEDPYDMDSFNQFKGNLVDFWESTSGIGPELARVAVQIHGICVNSASVERLWSSIGYLHTNRRNRLQVFFFYYFSFI
ncbi:unnamed protein product [Rhizophagus irregularis]|nr:unnamed protein product [Rhizophagus irregularis]